MLSSKISLLLGLTASPVASASTIAIEMGGANASDTGPAIKTLLESYGHTVDLVTATDIDDAAEIAAYDAVLIGDSGYLDNDWADFDANLEAYVDAGGGVLFSGWVPYSLATSSTSSMVDLLPVSPTADYEQFATISTTVSHEVTDGWTSFTAASYTSQGGGAVSGATVVAETSTGNDAVVYWSYGSGRSIHLSANYLVSETVYGHSAQYDGTDVDALESFVAAVEWAAGTCDSAAGYTIAIEMGGSNASDTGPAIQTLLEGEGYTVDLVTATDIDDATEIAAYDAVLIGDSGYLDNDWADFDANLEAYVDAGGGVLFSGWVPYSLATSSTSSMVDLLPVSPTTDYEQFATISTTVSHEVTDGWTSFTAASYTSQGGGAVSGATVVAETSTGNDAVVYWSYGSGRSIHLSANYLVSETVYGHSAQYDGTDVDALESFLDAVAWAAGVDSCFVITDADGDGYDSTASGGTDCDDDDVDINPGASEVCDGVDNDCDGTTDDGATDATTWYVDLDSDGFGDPADSVLSCDQPTSYIVDDTDCDDTDAAINPAAAEVCDAANTDEDCNGTADDDDSGVDSSGFSTFYADTDADGYGDATVTSDSCDPTTGTVSDDTDCDDTDASVNPGATEVCDDDDTDEDCNGTADDADSGVDNASYARFHADSDGDTYGDSAVTVDQCDVPAGHVSDDTDCDDTDAAINPGATEICDEANTDEDCNGLADDLDIDVDPSGYTDFYVDADGDGYGDAAVAVAQCDSPAGSVTDSTDCDDTTADVHPGADEVCNDVDDDCDGTTDGPDSVDASDWYPDADADGFTLDTGGVSDCGQPSGYSTLTDEVDCDDTDPDAFPGADEISDDGIDQDCDGSDDITIDETSPDDDGKGGGGGCSATGASRVPDLVVLAGMLLGAGLRTRRRRS